MHIVIAGNIGCGKTTLTRMLAKRYGWAPHFEPVDNNPYLADYYADMQRWSFNTQIFFLAKRFKEVIEIAKAQEPVVQDRSIFEDARIFAPHLHATGLLSDRDYATYRELFDTMTAVTRLPDLMIYIRSSLPHLVDHIHRRGRGYEQTMSLDYLAGLNTRYEEWIAEYDGNLVIIDGDNCDFEHNPEDFLRVTDDIDAHLFGLFA